MSQLDLGACPHSPEAGRQAGGRGTQPQDAVTPGASKAQGERLVGRLRLGVRSLPSSPEAISVWAVTGRGVPRGAQWPLQKQPSLRGSSDWGAKGRPRSSP